ncbi:MAG: ABC transporter permease [Rothia sp. (in: high G+C Gram-positive bacteria)]|uniref:ABC transporter permease n=1 Tax=Rothia sp. (in: high G+C Gram-positive bacteria) TaxID=1885016 RepID=UPI0026F6013D|nr:ABC transporter permease [Rothia sp. (in: high G+C Gram-positive bacteria)]
MSTNDKNLSSGPAKEPTTETTALRSIETNIDIRAQESVGKTQGQIVRKRFRQNTGAVISLAILITVLLLAITSIGVGPIPGWWKYNYTEMNPIVNGAAPNAQHWFGQDATGRDLFAMTMRGVQNTFLVVILITSIAGFLGVLFGGLAGYYRGWIEAVIMRFTDMVIIIPLMLLTAVLGKLAGSYFHGIWNTIMFGVVVGLLFWSSLARLVRAEFLSLREREFVDAARLAGASDMRIIFKHILPNAIGVVTVNVSLMMSSAILTETALSYLGFGIKAPDWSLGSLISANQSAFSTRPWLFWFPGLFILVISLAVNFVGDGLRDAFDPRQKKFNPKKATKRTAHSAENGVGIDGSVATPAAAAAGAGTATVHASIASEVETPHSTRTSDSLDQDLDGPAGSPQNK